MRTIQYLRRMSKIITDDKTRCYCNDFLGQQNGREPNSRSQCIVVDNDSLSKNFTKQFNFNETVPDYIWLTLRPKLWFLGAYFSSKCRHVMVCFRRCWLPRQLRGIIVYTFEEKKFSAEFYQLFHAIFFFLVVNLLLRAAKNTKSTSV